MIELISILSALGNAITAICYFAIPYYLIAFVLKRRDLPFSMLWILFGAFIAACGIGHAFHVVARYWPVLHPYAELWRLVTASISLATVLKLPGVLRIALTIPSPMKMKEANDEFAKELSRRDERESELSRIIDGLLYQIEKTRVVN